MRMIDGDFDGQELWFRCHHCGDSQKHVNKAHCSVNVFTSVYYCLRCGASGKLGSYDLGILTRGLNFNRTKQLEVDPAYEVDALIETIGEKIRSGPGLERYSALDRWHIQTEDDTRLDIFKVTNASGDLAGYHVRPPNKKYTRTYGKRLLGMSSKIKYNRPWRIVEGPFDCLDPHSDVAVFGFPSKMQAKELYGKTLIACPDGDVWEDYRKLRAFFKPLLWDNNVLIDYIERLPPGIDPDEMVPRLRERLSVKEVKQILTPKKSFFIDQMKPEEILQDIYDNRSEEEFWSSYA